jgi:hypothetical protein
MITAQDAQILATDSESIINKYLESINDSITVESLAGERYCRKFFTININRNVINYIQSDLIRRGFKVKITGRFRSWFFGFVIMDISW